MKHGRWSTFLLFIWTRKDIWSNIWSIIIVLCFFLNLSMWNWFQLLQYIIFWWGPLQVWGLCSRGWCWWVAIVTVCSMLSSCKIIAYKTQWSLPVNSCRYFFSCNDGFKIDQTMQCTSSDHPKPLSCFKNVTVKGFWMSIWVYAFSQIKNSSGRT